MSERPPDIDSLIDEDELGPEPSRFARIHDLLVLAGPLPELPDTLARPPAVAARRPPFTRPPR